MSALLIAAVLGVQGCARLGDRMDFGPLPPEAPAPEEVLADLAANDAQLDTFSASGDVTIASPELRAVQRIRGSVLFQRPHDLHVTGRHRLTGAVVCRLTAAGEEFLLEFPTEDLVFYELEGVRFASVPFSVSPVDIVREMFMPETWDALPANQVRMVDYDEDQGVALLEIGSRWRPHRRVYAAGPPWVVVRNERLGPGGNPIAVTTLSSYREINGFRFPAEINAEYPHEDTVMAFSFRAIEANPELDDDLFTIDERYRAAYTGGEAPPAEQPAPPGNRGRIGP